MGPFAAAAALAGALPLAFAAYFLLALWIAARKGRVRVSARAALESLAPGLALALSLPLAGVLLDQASLVWAAPGGRFALDGWATLDQAAAVWLVFAALGLLAAVPVSVFWAVDRDLASRAPEVVRLAHRALFRALTGLWPADDRPAVPDEDERWRGLLRAH